MNVDFLGLKLKSPVIVAAGPWNRNGAAIRRGFEAGAGAAVTETILSDAREDARPCLAFDGHGVANIRLYSEIQVEGWEREIDAAKKGGGVLIASISGRTPSEVEYLAAKMEGFGADAIEISLSSPMGEDLEVLAADPDRMYDMVKAVKSSVRIPVLVKLSQTATNIARVARAVKRAGGDGASAINTIRCILGVDIDTGKAELMAYCGYSGAPIRPLALASVATLAQTVDLPICGVGGIETYKHVLEFMMLGATVVQVGTAVLLRGPAAIRDIVSGLESWESARGLGSYDEIRGRALESLRSVGEIKRRPIVSRVKDESCVRDCGVCVAACHYDAIEKAGGKMLLAPERCTGCGACTFICPDNKFELNW
jgi:dihydroorotate dehydrogenase subfamily 1